jgi:MFS family permease
LGLAGLIQFLPVVSMFLWTGQAADRFSRKAIVMITQVLVASTSLGLAYVSWTQADYRWIYICLLGVGVARAFQQPAKSALLPLLVEPQHFSNAVAWSTNAFHLASVLGPAAGGVVIATTGSAAVVYLMDVAVAITFASVLLGVRPAFAERLRQRMSLDELWAGFRFVWYHPVILGALALDLFAVLLGGAVTLLPVFAEDILHVGASGLGWLRAAPAVGAMIMGMLLAYRPPIERTGLALLTSVAGFGLATIGFGLSTHFGLSILMLFLTGVLDNVSVVIRHTLIQTLTPNDLRGRVSAVNGLFIGASNELGGFESGVVAQWFGPVISVVSGGIGTIVVVAITAWSLPALRRHGRLS